MDNEYGIVIFDRMGGDFGVYIVDRARFEQIYNDKMEKFDADAFAERACYLCSDNYSDVEKPSNCPNRIGSLLKELHCQTFCPELMTKNIEGSLIGFLFVPSP
jgi:hypothetical protein